MMQDRDLRVETNSLSPDRGAFPGRDRHAVRGRMPGQTRPDVCSTSLRIMVLLVGKTLLMRRTENLEAAEPAPTSWATPLEMLMPKLSQMCEVFFNQVRWDFNIIIDKEDKSPCAFARSPIP
jgi:hypothetical protein